MRVKGHVKRDSNIHLIALPSVYGGTGNFQQPDEAFASIKK